MWKKDITKKRLEKLSNAKKTQKTTHAPGTTSEFN